MIRGLYLSTSGMLANLERQDVLTNNLANVSTAGFRRSVAVERANETALFRRFNDQFLATPRGLEDLAPAVGYVGRGVVVDETALDLTPGQTQETGAPLDLMIRGGGYFAVSTPQGTALTRHGGFVTDADGRLVTREGYPVLGAKGEILLGEDRDFKVAEDGAISIGGQVEDSLLVLRPQDPKAVTPLGNGLLATPSWNMVRAGDDEFTVSQGSLETSNVSAIREMVSMVQLLRAYEANQKMIQMQDETLEKAVTDLPNVRG